MKKIFLILSILWVLLAIVGLLFFVFGIMIINGLYESGTSDFLSIFSAEARFFLIFGFVLFFLGISFPFLFKAINRLMLWL